MEATLVVVGGDAKPGEIKLKLPAIIGRGRSATLTLPHPLVSRQHCELFESDGQLCVRDMGSLNGTFVGNERITEAVVRPGDLLSVGNVTFRAMYGDAPDLSPPSSPHVTAPGFRSSTPTAATEQADDVDFEVVDDVEVAEGDFEVVDVADVEVADEPVNMRATMPAGSTPTVPIDQVEEVPEVEIVDDTPAPAGGGHAASAGSPPADGATGKPKSQPKAKQGDDAEFLAFLDEEEADDSPAAGDDTDLSSFLKGFQK